MTKVSLMLAISSCLEKNHVESSIFLEILYETEHDFIRSLINGPEYTKIVMFCFLLVKYFLL